MGGRGSSMKGSQGMGGGAVAPAAAAQAMPAIQIAPVAQTAQAVPQQQASPPTGVNGFGHLTPQQVSAGSRRDRLYQPGHAGQRQGTEPER